MIQLVIKGLDFVLIVLILVAVVSMTTMYVCHNVEPTNIVTRALIVFVTNFTMELIVQVSIINNTHVIIIMTNEEGVWSITY